jgi:peptidoglycan/LPS O-acetylase OafA/YrhL
VIEVLVIAGAFGVLWPRAWWFAAFVGFIGLFVGPRVFHCFHCFGGYEIDNPFFTTQVVVTALLCLAAWRWRKVRPTRLPALRRLALFASIVTILTTAGFIDGGDSYDTYDFARVALAASVVLLACLVLEVRFHVPPLPTATARAAGPRRDRTGS